MMTWIYGILGLGALVVVHELGHFLVAKYFNVGVVEFAVGFGRKIFRKKWGETTYAVGLIPLGGYVRMIGDDPHMLEEDNVTAEDSSTALEKLDVDEEQYRELLKDKSRWFLTQGYWPRTAIVIAGPLANILFALVLSFAYHLIYGKPDLSTVGGKPVLGEVVPNFPADKAGLKPGDKVLSIDGIPMTNWIEVATTIAKSNGKELELKIQRNNIDNQVGSSTELTVRVTGTSDTAELTALDDEPKQPQRYMIGISAAFDRVPVGALEAAEIAPMHVWYISKMTVKSLVGLVSGAISSKQLAGPIYIFGEAARSAERGFDYLISLLILLNVSLAIFNLLPIPVLDGGHLLFFTIGALRGEPVSLKLQQVASKVGMCLLLALMLFAMSNDIRRFL